MCESGVVRVELAKLNIPDLNRTGLRTDEKIMMLVDCLSDFEKKARFALNNIEQDNLTDELVKSLSAGSGSTVQAGGNKQENQALLEQILDRAYPVGSIYMSVNATSPATLFGGTWERISGRFLLAADSSHAAGSMGGEANHTLTVAELPKHSHVQKGVSFGEENSSPIRLDIQDDGNVVTYDSTGSPTWAIDKSSSATKTYRTISLGVDGDTGITGGGEAHNNMPPYLAVYVWKRTA